MPTRLCIEAACGSEAVYRGRCQAHQRQTNKATHRNRRVYNSARWKHLRRHVLFEQPLCACGEIATDVDHIVALEDGGAPYERTNCQGLCRSCHSRKTRKEQQWLPTPSPATH